MRNKPRIRFKGFTEDWEQRKLGDIATFSKGNGYSKSDLGSSGDPIILYGRLYTNYETTISNVDTFVELKDKSIISQGGEVIVPASGETAEDISRASVVKNQGIIIGGDLNVIKANYLLDPTFLALTISNGEQQKELSKRAQGKSVVHLHNSDLQEVNLTFPLLNEQKEISTLFEKMDNIITLHQRKLEKLKLAKKALLQKLFPKNGSQFPEIRFKGFTDAWEQRKLIDIAKTFIGLVTTMTENYRDSGTLLIRNSDIKEGQFVFSENPIHLDEEFAEKNKTRRLQIGDVVTVHTGDIGTSAVIEEKEAGAIGFATISTRTDKSILNPYFLATYFNTEKHKCYANSVSTGDGRSNYNIKDFNKLVISVPTLDEQERISVLINDMNTIITLHQRKLDKLQDMKKGLLQKMFV